MCPFDSAKIDSLWASRSRSSSFSISRQGSAPYAACLIIGRPGPGARVEQLREVLDHDVGAVGAELGGLADPVHADHQGEMAGVTRRHARLGVLEDHRVRGGHASASAAARKVSGAGLPRKPRSLATTPSILTSNSPAMPAASRTCLVLALAETTAVAMPLSRTALM